MTTVKHNCKGNQRSLFIKSIAGGLWLTSESANWASGILTKASSQACRAQDMTAGCDEGVFNHTRLVLSMVWHGADGTGDFGLVQMIIRVFHGLDGFWIAVQTDQAGLLIRESGSVI